MNLWYSLMNRFRISPSAVCRQLLTTLKTHKPLTSSEEQRILHAIETSGVENATDRALATLSRSTIEKILVNIGS
jgi:hypothetical protein